MLCTVISARFGAQPIWFVNRQRVILRELAVRFLSLILRSIRMTKNLSLSDLHQLRIRYRYAPYDEPRAISLIDPEGNLLLAYYAEEGDTHDTWLYVQVSSERLARLENNEIDLRSAFLKPENNAVWVVKEPNMPGPSPTIDLVTPDLLDQDLLPDPGGRLI